MNIISSMISESSTETNRIDFSLLKSVGLKIMTAYLIQVFQFHKRSLIALQFTIYFLEILVIF